MDNLRYISEEDHVELGDVGKREVRKWRSQ